MFLPMWRLICCGDSDEPPTIATKYRAFGGRPGAIINATS
jgi:hypothetical protein